MKRLMTTWDDKLLQNPHEVADKRTRVQKMFAAIAPSYDINNRLHSLWMDQYWRRKAVRLAQLKYTDLIADVACGTGDLALKFYGELLYHRVCSLRRLESPDYGQVFGIDFTFPMLPLARGKAARTFWAVDLERAKQLAAERQRRILWINGDALSLPLPDASCDVLSI